VKRATLAQPVAGRGLGVASGREVSLRLEPAEEGFGLRALRSDCGAEVPLHIAYAQDVPNCTALACGGVWLYLVEHLMATLAAFGVTDLRVVTDGPEIPIFNGSAAAFCSMIREAGVRRLAEEVEPIALRERIRVEDGDRVIEVAPGDAVGWCTVSYHLAHPHPLIGCQSVTIGLPAHARNVFADEIAPARTFVLEAEARALQESGWLAGGGEDNAIVIYDDHYSAAPKLEAEFSRHKILDLLGDLYLLNRRVAGTVVACRTGHSQNRALARRLMEVGS
jgi:UDP-3-O-[3-hydroxymyristoyl] N-acetylglucosamine deacetylase